MASSPRKVSISALHARRPSAARDVHAHDAFMVRLRNVCDATRGFSWLETMPRHATLDDDPSDEQLVLFLELDGGECVAVDERACRAGR